MNNKIFATLFLSLMVIFSTSQFVLAHPHEGQVLVNSHTHQPQTEYIPLNGLIGIEKTSLTFHAENNNSLPWAFVEGKIANPVAGYPVIIQIYQNGDAVHFAQTDVNEDGNYEYKFRVLTVEDGKINKIFDGSYNVVIYKVVYSTQGNLV
ncbi:MAG: hypothetical protein ACE5RI_08570 [Candidatus Nitrosomaritimum yanchengensis]